MRQRLPSLGFHARLTLTIAGAFIGAMIVILTLALVAAQEFDLAIVSTAFNVIEDPNPDVMAPPPADRSEPPEPPEPAEPADAPDPREGGEDALVPGAVYVIDENGDRAQVVQLPEERFPTLIRWSLVVLLAFALIAIALASWISRRSLGRIASITSLARTLSERHLDRRLNLTGPDDEIKRLGDTFDGMLDRLERVFRNQRLFVANASHELRTPLTTARAALEIPLAQDRVPDDLRPSLERALNANRRSEELIGALLMLARGNLASPELRELDLRACVEAALDDARHQIDASAVTVHQALDDSTVQGNLTLLSQAVTNLVENAIRHNVHGGEVWIMLSRMPAGARLRITNTGAPYAPEAVERLIEPFHRHDATRTSGATPAGFGLGLAIVDSVAAMHGGSLHLAAHASGGLVVTLDLPDTPPRDGITPAR